MRSGNLLHWLLGLVTLLFCATALDAQLNRGVIEGIVTDPQGAVVPGVDVSIASLDTNVSLPTKTNTAGYYRVADLVPGKYRAHFVAGGFSTEDVNNIEVPAGEVLRVDAQLKIGASRELVQVTAELPMLETAATNASTSLETRVVQDIPVQGRDLQQLVFLVPGVTNVGGPPGSNFGFNSQYGTFPDPTHTLGSDVAVSGGQGGANAWYLDGNLNISGFAENVVVNPSPDAVEEFQAITNNISAEYSRTGGGVFNVVLKSGANAGHGDIYEFIRNDATNARNPFTSIDQFGKIIKARQLRFNNFGGTLGGPIYLPHLYNGKNKTFFFFSWDTSILHLLGSGVFSVPTARMRTGDFSEDVNASQFGLWDPYSTVGPNAQGLFDRTAFGTPAASDANGCLASHINASKGTSCVFSTQIPTNRLDPVAMFFTNSFPMPNYNDPLASCPMGLDGFKICRNFRGAVGNSQDTNNISIKIDHQRSEKSKYFAEWLFSPTRYRFYRVPWTGPTFPQAEVGWSSQYPFDLASQIIAFGNTYTLSSTLINEFRASFSRQFLTTNPSRPLPDSTTDQSEVQKLLAPIRIPHSPLYPSPSFYVYGPGGSYMPFGPAAWSNLLQSAEAYNFLDNVTKTIGKHTIKTGFIYRLEHTSWETDNPTGLSFGGGIESNPITGLGGGGGLSQFMLGAMASNDEFTGQAGILAAPYMRYRYWGFYGQDDYHITPAFTLNLGLRYDLFGWFRSRYAYESNTCLSCVSPITGLPGRVVYQGDPGITPRHNDLYPANKNDFGPRINFSWTPFSDRKTVIRGGYDMFYSDAAAEINFPGQGGADNEPGWLFQTGWAGSFNPKQCAAFTFQCVVWPLSDTTTDKSQLLTPALTTQLPALTKSPFLGNFVEVVPKPSHDPIIQSWSAEVERELPGNMMVSVGYVGTHGTHLLGEMFSQLDNVHTADKIKYKTGINASVPIADYYSSPQTVAALAQIYGSTSLPRSILLKPYPAFLGVEYGPATFDGTAIYHGLNLRVQKRYSHGLNFVAAYTVSKKITNWAPVELGSIVIDPIHGVSAVGGRSNTVGAITGGAFQDPDNKKEDRSIAADDIPQMLNFGGTYELPFGSAKRYLNQKGLVNGLAGGWLLTANFNAQSGVPLAISCPGNQVTSRCNLIGDPHFSGSRSKADRIADWINPAAFQPPFGGDQTFWASYDPNDPRAYLFGTAGARLPGMRSPGFWNLDAALFKHIRVTESKYFEFRWEAFNALNHQNLGFPNTSFCLPPKPDGTTDLVHQAGCHFGRITNIQTDPRSMEFALKFFW